MPTSTSPFLRRLDHLRRDDAGVTAIEFGIVALPFLLLLMAVLEAALTLTAQISFNNAVDRSARTVLTGVFQEAADGSDPAARLRGAICNDALMFSCTDLKVEVTTSPTFQSKSAADPYDPTSKGMADGFGTRFQCPNGDEVVTIRAATTVPAYLPLVDLTGRRVGTDRQLIMSTAVFRAEPYGNGRC